MSKVCIDLDRIAELAKSADKIVWRADGDAELVKLMDAVQQANDYLDAAKDLIAESAKRISPHFKSVMGDHITAVYAEYGPKYRLAEDQISQVPKEMYKKKVSYSVNSKEVDKWSEEHDGQLPLGIDEVDRKASLSLRRKSHAPGS